MIEGTEFAVVDTETTGLFPRRDRIVEIAVVRCNHRGEILRQYETLVNPKRDMGPTWIHGLTAADVAEAPTFQEVAGDVLAIMQGAVFVGHNAVFDWRFVRAEFERAGHALPDLPRVCTMSLARLAEPAIPSRGLDRLCEFFGIPHPQAHGATSDAVATVKLLALCFKLLMRDGATHLDELGIKSATVSTQWPTVIPTGRSQPRGSKSMARQAAADYLTQLVARLPALGEVTPAVEEYLALLDRCLSDRRISGTEGNELLDCARELGLVKEQVVAAHEHYLRDLMLVAMRDATMTPAEMKDITEVRGLLGVPDGVFADMLRDCQSRAGATAIAAAPRAATDWRGKTVCFTGEMNGRIGGTRATREFAEKVAADRGMIVKAGVSRSLDFLVCADPDSMSTKANKARDYGVRIVAEPVFWRLMGVDVE
ncbi:MAG: hypothetical protein HY763_13110 [Planctomycetes bacterium]|nr:hypothetical protein [Planctomycetota bacterium]